MTTEFSCLSAPSTKLAQRFLCFLLASLPCATTTSSNFNQYTCEGYGSWTDYNASNGITESGTYLFQVEVSDTRWRIRTVEPQADEDCREVTYDGTNIFYLCLFDKNVARRQLHGEKVGVNTAGGTVWKRDGPNLWCYHATGPPWLAYASSPYFRSVQTNEIELCCGMYTASGGLLPAGYYRQTRRADWSTGSSPPHLPSHVTYYEGRAKVLVTENRIFTKDYPKPFNNGFTNTVYGIERTTNVGNYVFPQRSTLLAYGYNDFNLDLPPFYVRRVYDTHCTNIVLTSGNISSPPQIARHNARSGGPFYQR
jgi:hypothetical protein